MKALSRDRDTRFVSARDLARAIDRSAASLIWEAEQSAALVQRLFFERRDQTRKLLSNAWGTDDVSGVHAQLPQQLGKAAAPAAAAKGPKPHQSLGDAEHDDPTYMMPLPVGEADERDEADTRLMATSSPVVGPIPKLLDRSAATRPDRTLLELKRPPSAAETLREEEFDDRTQTGDVRPRASGSNSGVSPEREVTNPDGPVARRPVGPADEILGGDEPHTHTDPTHTPTPKPPRMTMPAPGIPERYQLLRARALELFRAQKSQTLIAAGVGGAVVLILIVYWIVS
jgi:hypothetical protein